MNRIPATLFLIAVVVLFMAMMAVVASSVRGSPDSRAISTVLVSDETGHGSGVHIGNGYILTAAHVVGDHEFMQIADSNGDKQVATVLWSNKRYDVALILIDNYSAIRASRLSCAPTPPIGSGIQLIGNPINLKFIHTWGRISSVVGHRVLWKMAFIADATIAPGMSGGPALDNRGDVIGIGVGMSLIPSLTGGSPIPLSYVVPSAAVCILMDRK